ncbi:MAG: mannose-1-phosphate guanylyltransferase/mannose-6-phosphate isomerase [Magnetospirillum sp.]|nr:mannose-1-phosphate guanylyltransferase/mannose-6-phosphate isomerase [Magnetospirillum sp.]
MSETAISTKTAAITPVLLTGGAGTRLWPLSREHFPKQLLPLTGEQSMLQQTAGRFTDTNRFTAPIVVTNEALRFIVAEQMRVLGCAPQGLLLEPVGRNTAPAVAAAALFAVETNPDAMLLVVPSDHVIGDVSHFLELVDAAHGAARDGALVTFSILPTRPETGYGYIRRGERLCGHVGLYEVSAFVEKPDADTAKAFLEQGNYFWNSGMFLFSARQFLAELDNWAPDILKAVKLAVAKGSTDNDFFRLDAQAFASSPSISVDYAVMEHTKHAATIPCDVGWSDVGAWNEIWNLAHKDSGGNAILGDVILEDSRNCYVRTDGRLTTLVGVENLVVVVTDDAILVTDHAHAQDIKRITERLKAAGRSELTTHSRVYRPWGFYQSVHTGDRFQVKRLTVNPGARLSLQKHFNRAEHWVVVNGTALVTRDDETRIVRENESTYIPLGAVHRLENPGKVPLHLIEVQSGSYLGEDDIIRVEDAYGRT